MGIAYHQHFHVTVCLLVLATRLTGTGLPADIFAGEIYLPSQTRKVLEKRPA
jgi:hypothetical protein